VSIFFRMAPWGAMAGACLGAAFGIAVTVCRLSSAHLQFSLKVNPTLGIVSAPSVWSRVHRQGFFEISNPQNHRRANHIMAQGQARDWEGMWANGLAPGEAFDAARVEPMLPWLLGLNQLPLGPALVPGCGRGYAVAALARSGRPALGLDISPSAVIAAQQFLRSQELEPSQADVREDDFFAHQGLYSVIYDCTFLCAIPPSLRLQWAAKMRSLLGPGGRLVVYIFPIYSDRPDPADGEIGTGPPFPMSERLVRSLLEPQGFTCLMLQPVSPEMQARKRPATSELLSVWALNSS